jgi:hypothetical protein
MVNPLYLLIFGGRKGKSYEIEFLQSEQREQRELLLPGQRISWNSYRCGYIRLIHKKVFEGDWHFH